MKISFIIPAYNEEKLISNCIESIKKELFRCHKWVTDFEIIVVDNNSTDLTKEIVLNKCSSNSGVKVIDCYEKGVTHSRNEGYKVAKFPYLAFIDADNEIPNGWLDRCMWHFVELTDIIVVTGPVYYENQSKIIKILASIYYFFNIIFHKMGFVSIQGGNFIVTKRALNIIGGYPTEITFYGEDTNLAVHLSKYGKIYLDRKMWIYSSDRRLKFLGPFNTAFIYALNYFTVNIFKKAITKEHQDIRN